YLLPDVTCTFSYLVHILPLYYFVALYSFTPLFLFFNDTPTSEIYTLSLHDALPISTPHSAFRIPHFGLTRRLHPDHHPPRLPARDRKSTRLNSSHGSISYAVFCLKKKNKNTGRAEQMKPVTTTTASGCQ